MPFGRRLAGFLAKVKGPKYVSNFMVKCSMGSYCKKIPNATSGNAWLSRDPEVWEKYAADSKCNFSFTVSAYRDMLTAYTHVNTTDWAGRLQKSLPILIYSGDCDPVGNYGKGVQAVYAMLQQAQLEDVTLKLYLGGRHEMHNETNKDEVFCDLISWVSAHLS